VQPPRARHIDGVGGLPGGVLIAAAPADALITAGAERPAAVLRAGPVAGQQHHADIRRRPCVLEHPVQLIDGVRTKRVAHLGAVERDPDHRPQRAVDGDMAVIGDVGQIGEPVDETPRRGVKRFVAQSHRLCR
jgi:hypothetical protein